MSLRHPVACLETEDMSMIHTCMYYICTYVYTLESNHVRDVKLSMTMCVRVWMNTVYFDEPSRDYLFSGRHYWMADNSAMPGVCNVKRVYSIHMYIYDVRLCTMVDNSAMSGACNAKHVYSIHMYLYDVHVCTVAKDAAVLCVCTATHVYLCVYTIYMCAPVYLCIYTIYMCAHWPIM